MSGATIAPGPWRIHDRPSPRSMWPIRDANGKIVCYVPNSAVAERIIDAQPWAADQAQPEAAFEETEQQRINDDLAGHAWSKP